MTSLLTQALSPVIKHLPSLAEAGSILIDRDVRRDNAIKTSTNLGKIGIGASLGMYIDPDTPPETVVITLLLSLALYLYRRKVAS